MMNGPTETLQQAADGCPLPQSATGTGPRPCTTTPTRTAPRCTGASV